MEEIGKYALGGLLVGVGIYIMMTGKSKVDVLLKMGNEKARKITVDAFIGMMERGNSDIDSMILEFENSKEKDLEKFAKKKGRTRESYINSYNKYYTEAKKRYISR